MSGRVTKVTWLHPLGTINIFAKDIFTLRLSSYFDSVTQKITQGIRTGLSQLEFKEGVGPFEGPCFQALAG